MTKLTHKRFSYIRYVIPIITLVAMYITPQLLQAEEKYRYEPGKLIENKAALNCQLLASISLGKQEMLSITVHTKPNVIGTAHNGKKIIYVDYPYRNDGVSFACIFNDYTDGQLQLLEFGHAGNKVDNITKVKLLY